MASTTALALCLALLFLAAAGKDVEDMKENGEFILSEPGIRHMSQQDLRPLPCGPEHKDFCRFGQCYLDPLPGSPRDPRCLCNDGYTGERCDQETDVGASMAAEIRREAGKEECQDSESCKKKEEESEEQSSELGPDEVATEMIIPADNIEVTPCPPSHKSPCFNGGTCVRVLMGEELDFICDCPPGYDGDYCEDKVNSNTTTEEKKEDK